MDLETRCIHGCNTQYDRTGAVSVPIFQTATFAHPGVGESTGYDYTRSENPTREHLEATVAGLEGGRDALAYSSGMAAITALMDLFSPGDHIVASADLYGGTHRLFHHLCEKNGLRFTPVDTADLSAVRAALTPRTAAIYVETPTNPMMHVTDIAGVAALKGDALLVVDNTFLTPCCQRPLELGADVVVHSGTKYLGGHNDTLSGFLVARDPQLGERLRFLSKTVGACLAPFDSWLVLRGLKTLAVRVERQQQSAARVVEWLESCPRVRAVHYPGLPSHPQYEVSRRQASGFGAMVSFDVDSADTARALLGGVKLIRYAESLGGVESLITYPMLQTHADIPADQREAGGITDRLLRLSVGLEAAGDLIADLEQAMKGGEGRV